MNDTGSNATCSAGESAQIATTVIPIGRIRPNDYNPNRMSDPEFAELVAEVRPLGRLPKPVVVRQNEDGYQIIDGEHGWRAAQEAGLGEITCEVIEADEFEAMRQTYKRNQHGTHNPLLLGKTFRQMMAERGLSQRKLAKEIDVSEGTIQNALEYVKAGEVRNCYAAEHPKRVRNRYAPAIDELSLRQVRAFNWLPLRIANLWLDAGADLRVLPGVKTSEQVVEGDGEGRWYRRGRHDYHASEKAGLVEFSPAHISDSREFAKAMRQLGKWDEWERSWLVGPLRDQRDRLREYTKHYFRGVWYVREQGLMDNALEYIVDRHASEFLLTPEEFAQCIDLLGPERSSAFDFQEYRERAVLKKHGRKPDSKHHVRRDLMQSEVDNEAPEYIKESALPLKAKHDLLRLHENLREWKESPDSPKYRFVKPEYTEESLKTIASAGNVGEVTELDAMKTQWRIERNVSTGLRQLLVEFSVARDL